MGEVTRRRHTEAAERLHPTCHDACPSVDPRRAAVVAVGKRPEETAKQDLVAEHYYVAAVAAMMDHCPLHWLESARLAGSCCTTNGYHRL